VGKPVFIWMSIDGINNGMSNWKFKWERFFTTVGGSGKPVSYFPYFLVALGGWWLVSFVMKRRKKNKAA
jgi:signal peptidase I